MIYTLCAKTNIYKKRQNALMHDPVQFELVKNVRLTDPVSAGLTLLKHQTCQKLHLELAVKNTHCEKPHSLMGSHDYMPF